MANSKTIDAIEVLLEYIDHTTNLDDPMLGEIKTAYDNLTDYLHLFDDPL